MKTASIQIGHLYTAKVSGQIVPVRIVAESPYGGWDAMNTQTGRRVRIRTARRLRRAVTPRQDGCSTPNCQNSVALEYLGQPLCGSCWTRHCEDQGRS